MNTGNLITRILNVGNNSNFIKYYVKYIPKYCEIIIFIKPGSEIHSWYAITPNMGKCIRISLLKDSDYKDDGLFKSNKMSIQFFSFVLAHYLFSEYEIFLAFLNES